MNPPMQPKILKIFGRFAVDPYLLILTVLLATIGIFTLHSAMEGNQEALTRHILHVGIGFVLMFVFAGIPVATYKRWGLIIYLASIVLLIMVLFIGEVSKGAQRWLDIWLVRFQPSEILKIATPLLLCSILAYRPNLPKFLLSLVVIAIPAGLIIVQPDLGTALLIIASGLLVMFLAGLQWRWIILMLVLLTAAAPVIWSGLHDYQKQRALVFLNPESDPLGAGYHTMQSKIAVGSGGLWGKGWGNNAQVSLGFIPEHSTDFIFASYAEQFGFVGVCSLILLYLLICLRGLSISVRAADSFGWLIASSFIFSFALYFMINIAMVSGLLPITGVTLPLLSYGGTSIVILLASFGILSAVGKHRPMMRQIL